MSVITPTMSSSSPQFDRNISIQTSIQSLQLQQEIYSNLPANMYVPPSNIKFKHPKTKPYKNQGENESAANILHIFK